ncbi:MAG: hypothetical protein PHS14_18090 [Elusimicrobia bacterium]|nr:hypothetical protein [Elusimicrobiota bacterium]
MSDIRERWSAPHWAWYGCGLYWRLWTFGFHIGFSFKAWRLSEFALYLGPLHLNGSIVYTLKETV